MKTNQKGFGLIGVILVILLIVIIGGVGYTVYNSQKDKNNAADSGSTTNATTQGQSVKFVEIAALKLKINDPNNRDMKVKVVEVQSPVDGLNITEYTITPADYSQFDENCESPVAIFELNDEETATYKQDSYLATFIKNINGKNYYVGHPLGGCGDDAPGWDTFVRDFRTYVLNNLVSL
jgi:Tfp pilus assembly protein PilE